MHKLNTMAENLNAAKKAQNDEFYTQYPDIQKEINAYLEYNLDVFRDKTVLLPCDDPEWSNFTKFFAQNFENFGLKKLISTSYAIESKKYKTDWQPTLFETENPLFNLDKSKRCGKIFMLDHDTNANGKIDIEDLQWQYLEGDGDFRSDEVKHLRDEADIIVTNPPFSLFREFLAWTMEAKKKFIIIGNKNSITCKEVFPSIKSNEIWSGRTEWSGGMWFMTQPNNVCENDLSNTAACWFTNIDHGRRHQPLQLMTMADNLKFSKHRNDEKWDAVYMKFDNYDAIEVPFSDAIPSDYDGVMGVPITFLEKYCPEQFEILGLTQFGCHDEFPDSKKYNDYKEYRTSNDTPTGAFGAKTNENAVIPGKGKKKTYYMNSDGHKVYSVYKRVLIRKKQ